MARMSGQHHDLSMQAQVNGRKDAGLAQKGSKSAGPSLQPSFPLSSSRSSDLSMPPLQKQSQERARELHQTPRQPSHGDEYHGEDGITYVFLGGTWCKPVSSICQPLATDPTDVHSVAPHNPATAPPADRASKHPFSQTQAGENAEKRRFADSDTLDEPLARKKAKVLGDVSVPVGTTNSSRPQERSPDDTSKVQFTASHLAQRIIAHPTRHLKQLVPALDPQQPPHQSAIQLFQASASNQPSHNSVIQPPTTPALTQPVASTTGAWNGTGSARRPYPNQADPLPGQTRIPAKSTRKERNGSSRKDWDNLAMFSHFSDGEIWSGVLHPLDINGSKLDDLADRYENQDLTDKINALRARLGLEACGYSNTTHAISAAREAYAAREGISKEEAWDRRAKARRANGLSFNRTAPANFSNLHMKKPGWQPRPPSTSSTRSNNPSTTAVTTGNQSGAAPAGPVFRSNNDNEPFTNQYSVMQFQDVPQFEDYLLPSVDSKGSTTALWLQPVTFTAPAEVMPFFPGFATPAPVLSTAAIEERQSFILDQIDGEAEAFLAQLGPNHYTDAPTATETVGTDQTPGQYADSAVAFGDTSVGSFNYPSELDDDTANSDWLNDPQADDPDFASMGFFDIGLDMAALANGHPLGQLEFE